MDVYISIALKVAFEHRDKWLWLVRVQIPIIDESSQQKDFMFYMVEARVAME